MPSRLPPFGAIILAGGRGRRLGGADKPGLRVGGSTLAGVAVSAAVAAGARQVILVGPDRPELAPLAAGLPGGLSTVSEDPPGSGPVPALRCGLAGLQAPRTVLLAADLPFLRAGQLRMLREAVDRRPDRPAAGPDGATADPGGATNPGGATDPGGAAADPGDTTVWPGDTTDGPAGAVFTDPGGRPQWLAGCWRTAVLRSALAGYLGASLHGVLAPLEPVLLSCATADDPAGPWLDCDTPDDLELARRIAPGFLAQEGC